MGLDMYLEKSLYVPENSEWTDDSRRSKVELSVTIGGEAIPIDPEKVESIRCRVGYWRKFNALHNWMVQECADGNDDCQDIHLSQENVEKLVDVLEQISGDINLASGLLPTASGCFFGSTDYDDWYFDKLAYTLGLFREVLADMKENNRWSYIYSASW